jgi:fructokinase
MNRHFKVPEIKPISTIGAGDNFNAGLIYGLLKENVTKQNIVILNEQVWQRIISHGIDFASDVCMSYDNYVSDNFAAKIKNLN